ncbi:MAG TPA: serine/threonine-protein kinase [Polyangiaceae bacterium]|nr:serine/threonine-protein kinase [Polyangiaceae bacterium]
MPTRVLLLLLSWICAAVLTGCGGGEKILPLPAWTLFVEGREVGTLVSLPDHINDKLPAHPSRYELHAETPLPPEWQGKPLSLTIPSFHAKASLHANGREVVPLDSSPFDVYRGSGQPRWLIPADVTREAPTLSLEIEVDHRWTQSAWLDTVPRLSLSEHGDKASVRSRLWNKALSICALSTALFVFFAYAIIFLLDRRRSASYGWFTLEALAACSYPAFELGLLQPLLGVYDAHFMVVMVNLATVASIHFLHAQFQLGRPSRVWDAGLVVCAAAVLLANDPLVMTRFAGPVGVGLLLANVGYQVILLLRIAVRQRAKGSLLLLLSWITLTLTAAVDFAAWLGLGELFDGVRTAGLGITVIALAQSAELSMKHILSIKQTDELNAELAKRLELLEAKHREVEVLNEELKFQVQSRSEQLALALSRVGTPHGKIRPLEEGEIIEARYRVIRQVGEGAMGAVYEVERTSDKRRLALKMLTDVAGGLNVARFAREAQIISQIDHPNVVSIVDVDVSSSGFFYMVMEFVPGLSLRQQQQRYTDVRWAVAVLRQIADGLAAIHARGVVHRDLKPGNILVTMNDREGQPRVKIADFGISALESAPPDEVTAGASGQDGANGAPGQANSSELAENPPPPSLRSGGPLSRRDAGPPSLHDGAPLSRRDASPPSLHDGAPPSLPPQSLPPQSLPSQSLPEGMPASLRGGAVPPKSLRELLPPPNARSMADKLMEKLQDHDSWDTGPPASSHAGPMSLRPGRGPTSLRSGPMSLRPSGSGGDGSLTQTGALMGTPIYMAPELAAGVKFAKPSADIFSLGVIAYELLSGKSPFPEPPALMRLSGRTMPPPPSLRVLCPGAPPIVAAIIERCLARDPANRPTAREVAETLGEAVKLCA